MADLQPDNPYAPDRFPDPNKSVEFPREAKERFEWILTRYPTKEAALLPTLHLAQEVWGWISRDPAPHLLRQVERRQERGLFGRIASQNPFETLLRFSRKLHGLVRIGEAVGRVG